MPGTPEIAADGTYVFVGAGIELVVDPKHEGNAVRLSLDGKNVLATAMGAESAYAAEVQGSTLLLKSPDGTLSKRYRLDTARRSVEVSFTLSNSSAETTHQHASEAHAVALGGGVSFFPNLPQQPLVWLQHQPPRAAPPLQATLSAGQSWVASAGDGILFVKAYPDPSPTSLTVTSPYDAKTKQRAWLELAAQSSSFELPPGTFATWNVRWLLRHVPAGLVLRAGNPELVGFVRGVIQ
ncbi:MAG TPA: hypothetical protein VHB79_08575 [Polyangiaceae bacterium]|nr:hypothetical protein [Polyangiaceae bacterium]